MSRMMVVLAAVALPLTLASSLSLGFRVWQGLRADEVASYASDGSVAWDRVAADMPEGTTWLSGDGLSVPLAPGDDWSHDALGAASLMGTTVRTGGSGLSSVVLGASALDGLMAKSVTDMGTLTQMRADGSTAELVPIARLSLSADDAALSTFSWPVMDDAVAKERPIVTREHAARGEWNRECGPGEFPEGTEGVDWFTVGVGVNDANQTVRRVWEAGEADLAEARTRVERRAWRSWLADLVLSARDISPEAADLIERATSSWIIARCSWPVDATRDVIVCVTVG